MKKNKISKNWINRQKKDFFVRQSKIEGYRSRAVYKLQEINNKFKILKNGISVVDLGGAPGSWSQYLARNVKYGKILSIDVKEMQKIENIFLIKGDFTNIKYQEEIKSFFGREVDLVLSDMAADTTGNKNIDSYKTGELCLKAMKFAKKILKNNGTFVSKIFMGSTFDEILDYAKKNFKETKTFKPLSSRKSSKENFIICKKF